MLDILDHAHSGLRYVILVLIVMSLVKAYKGWKGDGSFVKGDQMIYLFTMIALHTQMLLGAVLYSISPYVQLSDMAGAMADPQLRFFTVEHILGMIIAIALVTIGRSKTKKMEDGNKQHKTILIFYGIGAVLIFLSIPWPFMKSFGHWF